MKRCLAPADLTASEPSLRARVAELYEKYGYLVSSRCRFLLRDDEAARDATHDVFVKIMRNLDGFRSESTLSTWMVQIATNHCLNLIAADRARWKDRFRRYVEHLDAGGFLAGADPERTRLVEQLLSRLDRETQAVVIHYYVDEMTQEEVARALGRSLPTIRKRLKQFQRLAQKELDHEPA